MHTLLMARVQEIVEPSGAVVRRKPVVGDMRWDGSVWRRWSGRRWARAAYSLHPHRLLVPARIDQQPEIDAQRRQQALALAVEDQVTTNSATVVFDGPHGVVLAYRRRVSHLFHAVMTIVTAGLWALVWVALFLGSREDRVRLEADSWGNVWARPVFGA
jgi:hypothetical protein